MPDKLKRVGVSLVAENDNTFRQALEQSNSSMQKLTRAILLLVSGLSEMGDETGKAGRDLRQFDAATGGVKGALASLSVVTGVFSSALDNVSGKAFQASQNMLDLSHSAAKAAGGGGLELLATAAESTGSAIESIADHATHAGRAIAGLGRTGASIALSAVGTTADLAGKGVEFLADKAEHAVHAVMGVGSIATKVAAGPLELLGVTAEFAAKKLDKMGDQAGDAARQLSVMGGEALATELKVATLSAVVGGVGLVGFAAGAAVVTAALAALAAGAGAAAGAFLGFGVIATIKDEAQPLSDSIKEVKKQMDKLAEAGKENTDEYRKLNAELSRLNEQFSHTFLGMLGTLKSWFTETSKIISRPIFDYLKMQLGRLISFVNSPYVQNAIPMLTQKVANAVQVFDRFITQNRQTLLAWGKAIYTIGAALSGPIITSLKLFAQGFGQVNTSGNQFAQNVKQIAAVMHFLGVMMATSSTILNGLVGGIVRGLAPALSQLGQSLDSVIKNSGGLENYLNKVSIVSRTVGASIGSIIGSVIKFGVAIAKAAGTLGAWDYLYKGIQKVALIVQTGLGKAGEIINKLAVEIKTNSSGLASFLFVLENAFEGVSIAAFLITPIFLKIAGAVTFLLNPFGLLITAITALGSAYATNFMGFRDLAIPVLDKLKKKLLEAKGAVLAFLQGFKAGSFSATGISKVADSFGQLGAKVRNLLPTLLKLYKIFSPLSIAFDVIKGAISGGLSGALVALQAHITDMGKVLRRSGRRLWRLVRQSFLPCYLTYRA
jgi:hypothetical protein